MRNIRIDSLPFPVLFLLMIVITLGGLWGGVSFLQWSEQEKGVGQYQFLEYELRYWIDGEDPDFTKASAWDAVLKLTPSHSVSQSECVVSISKRLYKKMADVVPHSENQGRLYVKAYLYHINFPTEITKCRLANDDEIVLNQLSAVDFEIRSQGLILLKKFSELKKSVE